MARSKQFKQEVVLQKAIELFTQKGYHGTSMDNLVKTLGINRASMYNTFGSKKELYRKALRTYGEERAAGIAEFLYYQLNVRQGIYKLFESLLSEFQIPNNKSGCLLVNSIAELANEDKEIKNLTLELEDGITSSIQSYLKYGVENGQVSHYKNVGEISSYFFLLYSGVMVGAINAENNDKLLMLVNNSISILD